MLHDYGELLHNTHLHSKEAFCFTMPLLRNYLPQNTSDVKKSAARKHYTNVSLKHVRHWLHIPLTWHVKSTSPFWSHHYKTLGKGAREASLKNVGWYTFPPRQNHNPPKKTHMKELRTWLSALLRISNSLSTISIVLITCYNYETWHITFSH